LQINLILWQDIRVAAETTLVTNMIMVMDMVMVSLVAVENALVPKMIMVMVIRVAVKRKSMIMVLVLIQPVVLPQTNLSTSDRVIVRNKDRFCNYFFFVQARREETPE
jgi:hypothetical protein